MDGHDRVVFHEAASTGGAGVENLDHSLHFEIMIALSERAHFGARAFYRAIRDVLGHSASHLAGFLDALEIARIPPTLSIAHRVPSVSMASFSASSGVVAPVLPRPPESGDRASPPTTFGSEGAP